MKVFKRDEMVSCSVEKIIKNLNNKLTNVETIVEESAPKKKRAKAEMEFCCN